MPQPSDESLVEGSREVLRIAFDVVTASMNDLDVAKRPAYAMAIFAGCQQITDAMARALGGDAVAMRFIGGLVRHSEATWTAICKESEKKKGGG